jgi:hypothetical protein
VNGGNEAHRREKPPDSARVEPGVSQRRGRSINAWAIAFTLALYASAHYLSPVPAFTSPEEGASFILMESLASRHWSGTALDVPAAAIDPRGEFADPFARASGGRWYSLAPPLMPFVASFPFALLGAGGAWAVPALAAVLCVLLSIRIGARWLDPRSGRAPASSRERAITTLLWMMSAVATPVIVHGALLDGHTLAAALELAALERFLTAISGRTAASGAGLRALLAAALCGGLAALAQLEAGWVLLAAPAAWALLRFGRARMDGSEGSRWTIPFLGLTAALQIAFGVVLASIVPRLLDIPPAHPAPAWGSPILLPAMIPAALAVAALLRTLMLPPSTADRGPGATPPLWPRVLLRVLLLAGVIAQSVGFRTVLSAREANVDLVSRLASTARRGEAIVCSDPDLPALAATLASSRPIFFVPPGAGEGDLLRDFDESGVPAFTAASPIEEGDEGSLPRRRSMGRFVREGEPARAGRLLIARFTGGGPIPSRPSTPPRGD